MPRAAESCLQALQVQVLGRWLGVPSALERKRGLGQGRAQVL